MAGVAAIRDLATLHQCTVWKAGRLTFKKLRQSSRRTWRRDDTLLNPACLATAPDHHPWMSAPADVLPGDREKVYDLIGTQLFRDATPRGHSRSMRFPLLTQPVMEACLKVPTWMCISNGRNRAVARDAFADRLPRGILDRRSKGSYTGYMAAVYARNKSQMREFLEEGQLGAQGLLDRPALAKFFASELAPRDLSFLRIFDLCAAENWARQQLQFPS
jgi:asparagine synthase (glutamine-hydrolysing)